MLLKYPVFQVEEHFGGKIWEFSMFNIIFEREKKIEKKKIQKNFQFFFLRNGDAAHVAFFLSAGK
jgi:hypothetical protein